MNTPLNSFIDVPQHVWQEVILDTMLIPIAISLSKAFWKWFENTRPTSLLFKGLKTSDNDILIYLSQLSVVDANKKKLSDPKFIAEYPNPTTNNRNNLSFLLYEKIDPLWSESDGRCAGEILNILGRVGVIKKFRIANTINDWTENLSPKFTIGFNPKTHDLVKSCAPIYYTTPSPIELGIQGNDIKLNCINPNDAGIIQKTFLKNTKIPIFIMAGMGVMGTEVSGFIFNKYGTEIGKLYGANPFCILFQANLTKGNGYHEIKALYPNPPIMRQILYPKTFLNWKKKKLFPKKSC